MKNYLFLFLLMIPPLSIFSQTTKPVYISGYAGFSSPTNQTLYTTSFNAGAGIEFATGKLTGIGFDANFSNFNSPKNEVSLTVMGYKLYDYGSYNTIAAMLFFKLQNADAAKLPVQPFVKVGLGASVISRTGMSYTEDRITTYLPDSHSTGILFAPSLGMNFNLGGKNKLMLEAQYRINKSGNDDIKAFLMNIGYSFRL